MRPGMRSNAFVCAAVLVLLFFAAWECAERRGFAVTGDPRLHALHLVRGIGASLSAAALVAWLMRRASPFPVPAAPVTEDQWWARGRLTEEQWERDYGRWFITMRWIAVAVSLALTFLATQVTPLLAHDLWIPLATVILVLGACNVCYGVMLRRGARPRHLLPVQIALDLVLLGALLHFSGGIENPLALLVILHVAIAGVVLPRRACFLTAAFASGVCAVLALGEWSGVLGHHTLLTFPHFHGDEGPVHAARSTPFVFSWLAVETAVLFLTAYFVTMLAERVRYDERQLAALADRAVAERQLLERAMETTGTGLRVLDRQLRPYWLNPQWRRLFAPESNGRPPGVPAEERDDGTARETLLDGQVRVTEQRSGAAGADAADGQRYLQVTTAPVLDKEGNVCEVVELAQDVTRQREAQARVVHAGRLAAMGELAGQVAHEVNNPIGVVSAKARLLLGDHRQEMSDHVAQDLEKITYYVDRVARVAQGLLTYCRPPPPARSRVDVAVPIAAALGLVEQRAREGGVEIRNEVRSTLPPVLANPDELEQVFCNLFLNALDAMPHGGRLIISGRTSGGQVEVVVSDTGTGISPDVRRRIFEPFFTTKQTRGTGLGLAICLDLVRGSGGTIEVESDVGAGSTFTVRLPVAHAPAEAKVGSNG